LASVFKEMPYISTSMYVAVFVMRHWSTRLLGGHCYRCPMCFSFANIIAIHKASYWRKERLGDKTWNISRT